ncbi:argonaute/piwi family protein [Anthocerotibacter panamensis]|uniref:argonaute/piwi family protein n=1 Tax=Anthocerotibacter panamensis TaxID=2857077 RepID=UPI001C404DBB|nr:Piwi domain-containing protein [Anthocerotibacter panamensis]
MTSNRTTENLLLNVALITFDKAAHLEVGVLPYHDKNTCPELRARYGSSHFFRRDGASEVFAIPIAEGSFPPGAIKRSIILGENFSLIAALAHDHLTRFLHSKGRKVVGYKPLKFLGTPKHDLLKKACGQFQACPDWLGIRLKYQIDVRVINLRNKLPHVGLILKVNTARIIDKACDALIRENINIVGLYVCIKEIIIDQLIEPHLKLIGKVVSIKGDELILEDYSEGFAKVKASECYLEPRAENLDRCMEQIFGTNYQEIKECLNQELFDIRTGKGELDKALTVINFLSGSNLFLAPGLNFYVSKQFLKSEDELFPRLKKATNPIYIFDVTGKHTDTWNDGGLNKYGPYDARTFTPRSPKICVICQIGKKGRVEQFLQKFLTGITVQNAKRQYFNKGFIRKFHLENPSSFEFFVADNPSIEAYRKAVREALQFQLAGDFRWDLAFVQTDESFHRLAYKINPYLVTKAAFLSQQIPVQGFEMETAITSDFSLQYVLNNISLATYAKLGGVPWLIKANLPIAHEFVFGLGSASIGSSRLGERERVVGITTVFSGDGLYHLHNLSDAVPIEDFEETLLKSVRAVIEKVKKSMNWQPREQVRLIFHAFKPFKNSEADAVEAVMKELGDYNVEFAYLHVAEYHPFTVFDLNQTGKYDHQTKTTKGSLAPERGAFISLSKNEVLLTLTGPNEVKRPEDGLPQPLHLKLHRNSTFRDMDYIANQVFSFSCHSWRTYLPSSMPVTIMYSELIAGLLGKLSETDEWNKYSLIGKIGSSRWFL